METTIYAKDLTKKDGFPSDIDRSKTVVVQITSVFNICLYTNKGGLSTNWFLPDELSNKYNEGIYIIKN